MKRPLPGQYNGPTDIPFVDPQFASMFPYLTEHLSHRTYDDGKPRLTSTLLIFVENDCLRMCLNDRDNSRSTFVNGETFDSAMLTLEQKLREGTAEWRIKPQMNAASSRTPF